MNAQGVICCRSSLTHSSPTNLLMRPKRGEDIRPQVSNDAVSGAKARPLDYEVRQGRILRPEPLLESFTNPPKDIRDRNRAPYELRVESVIHFELLPAELLRLVLEQPLKVVKHFREPQAEVVTECFR
jgi:hypothetical protein